jgi:hypothetical protein
MGLMPPPPEVSPSDRLAFENHLAELARGEVAGLDPASKDSLLPSSPGSEQAWRSSEVQAIAVAHAYGVEISFVHGLPAWLSREDTLGIYQQALPGYHHKAQGVAPEQNFPGRKEQILIEATLGPEARASVAWHEIAHLALGHTASSVPDKDLTIGGIGARSQEYIANAFSAIMLSETVAGAHPYISASAIGYMERFESAIEVIHNPDYTPETWDRSAGVQRATEFFRQNQDMILQKVADIKQVIKGVRLPQHSIDLAVIPPDQQIFPADISGLYSRLPAPALPSPSPEGLAGLFAPSIATDIPHLVDSEPVPHLIDSEPTLGDFFSGIDFAAPFSLP